VYQYHPTNCIPVHSTRPTWPTRPTRPVWLVEYQCVPSHLSDISVSVAVTVTVTVSILDLLLFVLESSFLSFVVFVWPKHVLRVPVFVSMIRSTFHLSIPSIHRIAWQHNSVSVSPDQLYPRPLNPTNLTHPTHPTRLTCWISVCAIPSIGHIRERSSDRNRNSIYTRPLIIRIRIVFPVLRSVCVTQACTPCSSIRLHDP